ncbi:MAG: ATP-binding protein [Lachnospiraceae bacterium]|nr:ATP-binding protein [Lachnospiraceae bacterium]
MKMERQSELEYLTGFYEKKQPGLLVVYGQKGTGKTTMLKEFIKDKNPVYYLAREASEREQLFQMARELSQAGYEFSSEFPDYQEVFGKIGIKNRNREKPVLVFDEFQYLIKGQSAFMEALVEFLQKTNALVLLVSSFVGFIENSMVKKIGRAAYSISGFLKIKELTFREISRYYKAYTLEQLIETYSILGGITGYLPYFDKTRSTRENICEFILKEGTFLQLEGNRLLEEVLREPAVYHSILAALASGKKKLNDLYKHTGFSRAKISVYLKNLMELEFVEKVFSYDTKGREHVQKGLYQIRYPYMDFWFRFIFPNLSSLSMRKPEEFYQAYIAPGFKEYCGFYFSKICREYMDYLNEERKLPFHYEKSGIWAGKDGSIDMLASNGQGKVLAVFTKYDKGGMTYEDYQRYLYHLEQARVMPDDCYLFSMGGFDERLRLEAKVKLHLYLKNVKEEPICFS